MTNNLLNKIKSSGLTEGQKLALSEEYVKRLEKKEVSKITLLNILKKYTSILKEFDKEVELSSKLAVDSNKTAKENKKLLQDSFKDLRKEIESFENALIKKNELKIDKQLIRLDEESRKVVTKTLNSVVSEQGKNWADKSDLALVRDNLVNLLNRVLLLQQEVTNPKSIVKKLESLKGDERLSAKAIKGLEEYVTSKVTVINSPGSGASNNNSLVDSVNGQTGVVVLDTDDIEEGSVNKYFNESLAIAYAIAL